jgi:hypothetical protein
MKLKLFLMLHLFLAVGSMRAMDTDCVTNMHESSEYQLLVEGARGIALCGVGLGPLVIAGNPLVWGALGVGLVFDQTGESKKWLAPLLCIAASSGFTFVSGAQKLLWCAEQMGYSRTEALIVAAAGSATLGAVFAGKKVTQLLRGHTDQ